MIRDARTADLEFVATHLRKQDIMEMSVTRDLDDVPALVEAAKDSVVCKVAITKTGEPVFAFGAKYLAPHEVQLWGFGTDRTTEMSRAVTRYIKQTMIPGLVASKVMIGRALVHPKNRVSQRWLKFLGFVPEATVREMGTRKEDMLLYVFRPAHAQRKYT
jgi:hypothetical protein